MKKEATEFTQYMEAALMGWAGITARQNIPRLWLKFLTSKRMDDHRLNLHRRMKELAKKKEMEFERNCYFPDKVLKDILGMSPNAGGNIPTLASLGRGNTIGACRPCSAEDVEFMKRKEKADKDTRSTRTFEEAMQMDSGDVRWPAKNYRELRVCISIFGLLQYAVYGEECDFAVKLHEVYKVLLLPQVINQEHKFTEELCKQVVWAIHEDKCEFFSVRLHPDDFGVGKTPSFPTSDLDEMVYPLKHLNPILRGSFPEAWKTTHLLPKAPTIPPPTTPAPSFYQLPPQLPSVRDVSHTGAAPLRPLEERLAHVHEVIANCLAPYHQKFNGRMMLTKVLKYANLTWAQLPTLEYELGQGEKRKPICFNHALGWCNGKKCKNKHVNKHEVSVDFANTVCQLIRPGIEYLLKNEPAAPAGGQNYKRGNDGGTGGPSAKQARMGN